MNYSELLQLAKGWGNFLSDRIIIWRLPYNGSGTSSSGYGQGSLPTVSSISGNTVNLGGTMNLTHSLNEKVF